MYLLLALINRVEVRYGRIHTDRLSSVNKTFIIWQKQEQLNSFDVSGKTRTIKFV